MASSENIGGFGDDAGGNGDENENPDPSECDNLEEYIIGRAVVADEPLTPAGIIDEYDCNGDFARHVFSDLADEGVLERVDIGEYVLALDEESDESVRETVGSALEGIDGLTDSIGGSVATAVEYAQQQAEQTEPNRYNDRSDDADEHSENGGEVTGVPREIVVVAGVIVLVVVLWQLWSSSDDSNPEVEEQTENDGSGSTGGIGLIE